MQQSQKDVFPVPHIGVVGLSVRLVAADAAVRILGGDEVGKRGIQQRPQARITGGGDVTAERAGGLSPELPGGESIRTPAEHIRHLGKRLRIEPLSGSHPHQVAHRPAETGGTIRQEMKHIRLPGMGFKGGRQVEAPRAGKHRQSGRNSDPWNEVAFHVVE